MNWEEHFALTKIAEICGSVKAKNQIKRFEKKLALIEGLQLVYCDRIYENRPCTHLVVIRETPV